MWHVPVRILVKVLPVGLISVAGALHIYNCVETLLSPGTGFTTKYPTKTGYLTITCRTYSIDLAQQTVVAEQLVIRNSDGSLLARVPHLIATGIAIDQGLAPKVQLKDAELWVTRDAKGELDVLNLFPKTESTKSQQPWQVSVRDSILHFHDLTVPGGIRNELTVETGNFVGLGDNIEGGATADVPGLIKGQIGFKKSGLTTTIFGKKVSGHLGPIIARLRAGLEKTSIKSIDPLRLESGIATGDFSATFGNGKPQFLANITADAKSPQWSTYRADSVHFAGTVSEKGLVGKAKVAEKSLKGDIDGTLNYEKGVKFAGNVKFSGLTPANLEAAKLKLPKDITFTTADSQGLLTYAAGHFGWNGKTTLTSSTLYGIKVPHIDGDVSLVGDQLLATIRQTPIGATLVDGNLGINLKTKAIAGAFSTPQLDAKDFSKWLPTNVLESKARLVGLIDGTLTRPNVLVKGTLDPKIKLADRTLSYNPADVVLRFDGNIFTLDRLSMVDDTGSVYASGKIDLKKGINVKVVANNVDLGKLATTTSGKVDIQGQITGLPKDLKYGGKVQGYRIGYDGIPGSIVALATDFSGDAKSILLKDIDAMKGASQITGRLGIGFEDHKLDGLFAVNGIEVSDLYRGPVGGILDFKDVAVSGTFAKPQVNGSFAAKKILAYNFAADSAVGKINYDGERFRISEASAKVSNGSLTDISGELVAKTKTGKVAAKFRKLDLTDISQTMRQNLKEAGNDALYDLLGQLAIKGATSGSFDIGINDGKFASLTSNGRVDDVLLNKAVIGSGDWDASFNGNTWQGDAFIGSLAEYFRIDNGSFTPSTGTIGGEFLSYKIPLHELIVAAEPRLNLSPEALDQLNKVNGKLGTLVQFSGTAAHPIIEIPEFEISSIALESDDIGTFTAKASFANNLFTMKDGLLLGPKQNKLSVPFVGNITLPDSVSVPDGTAKIAGTATADKLADWGRANLNFAGSIFGFPVSKFASLAPSLKDVDVLVTQANFNVTGTVDKPLVGSHVNISAGIAPDRKKVTTGLLASRLKFEGDISTSPGQNKLSDLTQIATKGTFKFNSIQGNLDANFYANSAHEIDKQAPLLVSAKLDGDRDVTEFFKGEGLTLGEKGAHLKGGFDIGGTYAQRTFAGGLDFNLDSLKITNPQPMIGKPIDTILRNIASSATIENDAKSGYVVHTKLSTASNYNFSSPGQKIPNLGTVALDAKIPIDDFRIDGGDITAWNNRTINEGTLAFNNLGLFQSFAQNTFAQATIFTETGKPVKIAGTVSRPKISGDIFFDDVKTVIPTLLATKGGTDQSPIEPEFDLRFFANSPMSIKTSLTSVIAKGSGSIKGTLSNLKADALLTVDKGDLLLPGGNVKLSPDGTITLRYDNSAFNNQAQLIADLHGETSLTALKNGITPERYDISIDIKGDLLNQSGPASNSSSLPSDVRNGLTLTAVSTPGDLTQDRILQLLGRTDLLQSLLQSGVNSSIENDLKNAGFGVFVPSFFRGVTNDLAKSFHLDYLDVDYNAFEQASVSFVKTLGKGFFIQGRQQLFQPLPGQPIAYDFRLAYRPRRGPNSIQALSFSIGTDQLRPYKLSVDYTNRVRTTHPGFRSYSSHLKIDPRDWKFYFGI